MRNTWVGYPVQSNLWRLPEAEVIGIVSDLAVKASQPPPQAASLRNFLDWLEAGFGKALTKSFMAPYNAKVWAHPPDEMNLIWVGERVATIKFSDILRNVINRQDAPAWGPNAQFRYPLNGTGLIWEKVFDGLPKARKRLNARVARVRTKEGEKAVELTDGTSVKFDALLSTILQPQRPGDPAILYTDPAKIMFEIGTPLWHRTPSPGTSFPPPLGPLSVRSPGAKRGARPTLVTWTRPSSEDLLTTVRAVHRLAATLHRHRDDGPPWLGVASGPLRVVSCALR